MTDNQLIDYVATRLEAASAAAGWNYLVVQKNQPTLQGVPTAPTIYFEKLFDHPYGWPQSSLTYQPTPDNFDEKEVQLMETVFQISALVIQDPADLTIPTASDVCNYLKQYIGSVYMARAVQADGCGILRVTEVRNPYFEDDRDTFEANPSFDFTIMHNRSIDFVVNAANRAVESEVGVKAVA